MLQHVGIQDSGNMSKELARELHRNNIISRPPTQKFEAIEHQPFKHVGSSRL